MNELAFTGYYMAELNKQWSGAGKEEETTSISVHSPHHNNVVHSITVMTLWVFTHRVLFNVFLNPTMHCANGQGMEAFTHHHHIF